MSVIFPHIPEEQFLDGDPEMTASMLTVTFYKSSADVLNISMYRECYAEMRVLGMAVASHQSKMN